MKKFLLVFALFIGVASYYNTAGAQNINVSINIGRQPAWGPVGYDYVGYYYFPDIDCYYDVNIGMFYYFDRGRWISARYLPYAYSHYDLYGLYKVVLNVRDPWRYHHSHYRDYARYRGHRNQIVIRDSRDYRYRDSRNNRVVWYSGDKHSNRKYDNNHSGRPANNYNNDRKDNYRPDKNYNNNRKDNNYRGNKDRDNKRSEYNNRNDRPGKNENRNSRPSVNRNNSRDSKEVKSSSNRSNLRMASNTNSERSSRR